MRHLTIIHHFRTSKTVFPPKRQRVHSDEASPEQTSRPQNVAIASQLRARARGIDGSFGMALNVAARNVASHVEELKDVMALVKVPGVKAGMAEMIVAEILRRCLTEDEHTFLEGMRLKCR
jgi:hypothetical protein